MENVTYYLIGFVLFLFTAYSTCITFKEPFFKSVRSILTLRWGKQIIADLYLGLLAFNLFVFLHEGSILKTLPWLVGSLIMGNIVTYAYLMLNFFDLLARSR